MNHKNSLVWDIRFFLIIVSALWIILLSPAYAAGEKNVIVKVEGRSINFDVKPYIDSQSRTIVPLRFIGEELGYSFAWDPQTKTVAFTGNGILIFLPIGQKEATVDGKKVLLDTTAVTLNGRAMVPLRFILENLGASVQYDQNSNTVNIMPQGSGTEEEDNQDNQAVGKTAVISGNAVNVRSGPGLTYQVLTQVGKGNAFTILDQNGDWYQLAVSSSITGWVLGSLLAVRMDSETSSRSEEPGEERDIPGNLWPEQTAYLTGVDVEVSGEGVLLSVTGDHKLSYSNFTLDNPKRLVIDFYNCILDTGENGAENITVNADLATGVRMAQFAEGQVRVVVDVTGPAGLSLLSRNEEGSSLTFKVEKPSIKGKTIVIDPGHASIQPGGWADPGAIGPSNLYEKDVVLDVGLKLGEILKAKGANVIYTRTGNTTLTLAGRSDVANKNSADIFVSIHANANTSPTPNGTTTYFYGEVNGQWEARQRLAGAVQQELVDTIQRKNLGVQQASFAVLRYTMVPSILVETAFISNYEEEQLLANAAFRLKVAQGIAKGIEKYFLD